MLSAACGRQSLILTLNRASKSRPSDGGFQGGLGSAPFRSVADQSDDLGDNDFPVEYCRRNLSLPIGTYLHSQWPLVHWPSGNRGTSGPEYSTLNWACTASHASRPGRTHTLAHGCGAAPTSQCSGNRARQQAGTDCFDRSGSRTRLRNTHRTRSGVIEQNELYRGRPTWIANVEHQKPVIPAEVCELD